MIIKQLLTDQVERYFGPKVAAAAAGAVTLAAQVQAKMQTMAAAGVETSIGEVMNTALATNDWVAALPAPLVAIATFFFRRAKREPADVVIDDSVALAAEIRSGQEAREEELTDFIDEQLGDRFKNMDRSIQEHYTALQQLEVRINSVKNNLERRVSQGNAVIHKHSQRIDALQGIMTGTNAPTVELIDEPIDDPVEPVPLSDERFFGDTNMPRNLRNNNALNIEATVSGKSAWKGEMLQSDGRYARFETPQHGIRAGLYLLRKAYTQRHGLLTVHDIIHRWAPLGDNSEASVNNYIAHVSKALGVTPKQILRLEHDDEQLIAIFMAMAEFEGGLPLPYSDSTYKAALTLL